MKTQWKKWDEEIAKGSPKLSQVARRVRADLKAGKLQKLTPEMLK